MIDWDRFNALKADIGPEDFADVAFLFVSEISETLDKLRSDPEAATAADFHFLRGSAANLGLKGMAEACNTAEAACKAHARPDIAEVSRMFEASIAAMSDKVPGLAEAA